MRRDGPEGREGRGFKGRTERDDTDLPTSRYAANRPRSRLRQMQSKLSPINSQWFFRMDRIVRKTKRAGLPAAIDPPAHGRPVTFR